MNLNEKGIYAINLKTENIKNPLGISPDTLRFSWEVSSVQRSQVQTAYEITVCDENGENVWSTGKVNSNDTVGINYSGEKLDAYKRYIWKVRLWNGLDTVSEWSENASFETGLRADDWSNVKWIGALNEKNKTVANAPYLRKQFSVSVNNVKKARAYITGLGYYELTLNGKRVGDNVVEPLVTRYHKRYFYNTYDVTNLLCDGENAVGVILGHGNYATVDNCTDWQLGSLAKSPWTGNSKLRMKIRIEYTDGSNDEIITDEGWKTDISPFVFDMPYYGDAYDARLEQDGWNQVGFDDSAWKNVMIESSPDGIPESQTAAANRIVDVLYPVSVTEPKPNVYVFDMGRIVTGWAELSMCGNGGETVKIQYAERLCGEGDIERVTFISDWTVDGEVRQPQTDYYTLKGGKIEKWESKFTYKGFRYIQVTDYPGVLKADSLRAKVVNADLEDIGTFKCSNETFNYIHEICRNTLLNNLHSYPSDTPVYENLGYLADGHLTQDMGMYNFDMTNYYEKWMNDIRDQVRVDGFIGHTAPAPSDTERSAPEWPAAVCIVPWQHYRMSGDKKILSDNYETMKKVFRYQRNLMKDDIAVSCFGDHGAPDIDRRILMISPTAYVYHMADILAKTAKVLEQTSDVDFYASECNIINTAFQKRFYNKEAGYYCEDESCEFIQSAQILPLAFGMVPERLRCHIYKQLSQRITAIDTGIFGTKYIFSMLTEAGYGDIAYKIADLHAYPSYGYYIDKGATSLWEGWGADGIRSHDHHMFATIDDWFYKTIGGIKADKAGFLTAVIRPYAPASMTFAVAKTRTVRGIISSSWIRSADGDFTLDIVIPANVTATVYVPATEPDVVTESGVLASQAVGVRFIRMDNNCAVYHVGSGTYSFKSIYAAPNQIVSM